MTSLNSLKRLPSRFTIGESIRWVLCIAVSVAAAKWLEGLFPVATGLSLGNSFLTISLITREALRVLENNLTFTRTAGRQFDDRFAVEGAKIGTTLNVRKPPKYTGRTGQALSLEAMVETQVPVTLSTQFGVDMAPTSQDLAVSIDDFSKRFLTPAVATIANKIDFDGLQLYKQIYQSAGTPGTVPSTLATYLSAKVLLDNSGTPMDGQRSATISSQMEATLVQGLSGLFQSASAISEQYIKGKMGLAAGYTFYMDQNTPTHTAGVRVSDGVVDGAGQSGATLNLRGFTAGDILEAGDIFTIAGVNGVHVQSRESTGVVQQFTVLEQATADGAGDMAVSISPSITAAGAQQTVTAAPADGAVVTYLYTSGQVSVQGMCHHADAFTLACADLPLPGGVDMAGRMSDKQLGLSIRVIRAYDIYHDQWPTRLDILYGWAVLRPELACRVQS